MKLLAAAVSSLGLAFLVGALAGCEATAPVRVLADTTVRATEDASYAEAAIRGSLGVDAKVSSYNVMSGSLLKRTVVIARLAERPPTGDVGLIRGRVYRLVRETYRTRVEVLVALSPQDWVPGEWRQVEQL
jgi:hypothetical protein